MGEEEAGGKDSPVTLSCHWLYGFHLALRTILVSKGKGPQSARWSASPTAARGAPRLLCQRKTGALCS